MKEPHRSIDTKELLAQIKLGDEKILKQLYDEYRDGFLKWCYKNHRLTRDQVLDIYQKSFTILYFNVKDGKADDLNSSLNTYLYGIGKNLIRKHYRDKMANFDSLESIPEVETVNDYFQERQDENHKRHLVRKILDQLKEPCRSILWMHYFKNFSMEAIANSIGYKNESVAKKKKCQCLKLVRERLTTTKLSL
ncbi:sigma-70 family RNA polymerase sigma factor [Fulvivirgaceae bacterium BMA12]|uniref:Sigma-70 family RNA polymerase sigma factor n=1 Tax=Agaribacillus aureus TaxID=3051825 RepID=A0ABT8LKG8_9BACT|nr:sigma-70 family RNA polymerase sigma factor [Fulvivirgaceae bacterium BMA12]